jgi:hypothetical protein
MKKLKLNLSNMEGVEVLSREQLKKVMGGDSGGSGNVCCDWTWAEGVEGDATSQWTGTVECCQETADAFCYAHDECSNVGCN